MSTIDNGGPAFPTISAGVHLPHHGMSLRAYFAGQALQGLLSNSGGPIQVSGMTGWGFTNCDANDVALVAVSLADAMIAELNKTNP